MAGVSNRVVAVGALNWEVPFLNHDRFPAKRHAYGKILAAEGREPKLATCGLKSKTHVLCTSDLQVLLQASSLPHHPSQQKNVCSNSCQASEAKGKCFF